MDPIPLAKHIPVGSLHFYADVITDKIMKMEINQVLAERESKMLFCTLHNTKLVCSATVIDTHRKLT